jgi:hypothetical protein
VFESCDLEARGVYAAGAGRGTVVAMLCSEGGVSR